MTLTNVSIRGESYTITNASDLLLSDLVQILTDGARGRKGRAAIADIFTTACPDIPADLVAYNTDADFKMVLDSDEIAVFTGSLTVATLKAKLNRLTSESVAKENAGRVAAKIKELKETIKTTEESLSRAAIEFLLGNLSADVFPKLPGVMYEEDTLGMPTTSSVLPQDADTKISELENQLARLRQKPA